MSGSDLLVLLIWLGIGAPSAYFLGRTQEWGRVLDYLHRHEDDGKTVWWVAGGIACGHHRKEPGGAAEEGNGSG